MSALIVVLVAGLSACQSAEPSTSQLAAPNVPVTSAPSASAAASASPTTMPAESTQQPSPADSPEPVQLRRDSFARVVTEDLRVRTEPFIGDASRKLEPLLWDGADVFVIDGPVAASGYDWYLVDPLPEVDVQVHPDPPPPGWVAAGSGDGAPWLAPREVECFDTPLGWLAFEILDAPIGASGLSCFGDRTLRFTASLGVTSGGGCTETTGPWSIDPAWLGPCPDPA